MALQSLGAPKKNVYRRELVMNALRRILFCSLFYVAVCPLLYGQALSDEDPAERVLRNHAGFLNELSDRRRLNSFFPN